MWLISIIDNQVMSLPGSYVSLTWWKCYYVFNMAMCFPHLMKIRCLYHVHVIPLPDNQVMSLSGQCDALTWQSGDFFSWSIWCPPDNQVMTLPGPRVFLIGQSGDVFTWSMCFQCLWWKVLYLLLTNIHLEHTRLVISNKCSNYEGRD